MIKVLTKTNSSKNQMYNLENFKCGGFKNVNRNDEAKI